MECAICKKDTLPLDRRRVAYREVVCESCFQKAKPTLKEAFKPKSLTVEELKSRIINLVGKEVIDFKATSTVGEIIKFDDDTKRILFQKRNTIHDYGDIESFEIRRDDETVSSKSLGRAITGGIIFGGAGAVVGAVMAKDKEKKYCDKLDVLISVGNNKKIVIPLIKERTETSSDAYYLASLHLGQIVTKLDSICKVNDEITSSKKTTESTSTPANEIRQFKKLMDEGIITKEEFDKKKKELLGL